MSSERRRPQRTCALCRTAKDKDELIRIVREPSGEVRVDVTGRANGRGVYLCRDSECLMRARRSGALSRALKAQIPDDVYERLEEALHESGL